jgi:hypothetical protein
MRTSLCMHSYVSLYAFVRLFTCMRRSLCICLFTCSRTSLCMHSYFSLYAFLRLFACIRTSLCMHSYVSLHAFVRLCTCQPAQSAAYRAQHTSAYISMRQHTSLYLSTSTICGQQCLVLSQPPSVPSATCPFVERYILS